MYIVYLKYKYYNTFPILIYFAGIIQVIHPYSRDFAKSRLRKIIKRFVWWNHHISYCF